MLFFAGIVVGLLAALFISWARDDSLPGRIVITGDGGRNPRFRWSLQTCRGKTVCNSVGSFAEAKDAALVAKTARRMMMGARIELAPTVIRGFKRG